MAKRNRQERQTRREANQWRKRWELLEKQRIESANVIRQTLPNFADYPEMHIALWAIVIQRDALRDHLRNEGLDADAINAIEYRYAADGNRT